MEKWVQLVEVGGELQEKGRLSREAEDALRKIVDTYLMAVAIDTHVEETRLALSGSGRLLLPPPYNQ